MPPIVLDKGSPILVEVVCKERTPHSSWSFLDPSSSFVTVLSSGSTVVATSTLSATNAGSSGLFHTIIPTSSNWTTGQYSVNIIAYGGSYYDVTQADLVFELE